MSQPYRDTRSSAALQRDQVHPERKQRPVRKKLHPLQKFLLLSLLNLGLLAFVGIMYLVIMPTVAKNEIRDVASNAETRIQTEQVAQPWTERVKTPDQDPPLVAPAPPRPKPKPVTPSQHAPDSLNQPLPPLPSTDVKPVRPPLKGNYTFLGNWSENGKYLFMHANGTFTCYQVDKGEKYRGTWEPGSQHSAILRCDKWGTAIGRLTIDPVSRRGSATMPYVGQITRRVGERKEKPVISSSSP
jgi:hypothetical protein